MSVLGELLIFLIQLYIWVIIATVIVSWLLAFDVISTANKKVSNFVRLLGRATDPVMQPVQRVIPSIGGIDVSPIVVLFGLMLLQNIIGWLFVSPYY